MAQVGAAGQHRSVDAENGSMGGEAALGSDPDVRELRARIRKLSSLAAASRSLTGSLDIDRVLREIVTGAVAVIEAADSGILALIDEESQRLHVRACVGFGDEMRDLELMVGQGLTGDAFRTGKPAAHDALQAESRMANLTPEQRLKYSKASGGLMAPRAALVAPLLNHGRAIGAMVVENLRADHAFDKFDLEVLHALAAQAAIALVNARLYEAESRSRAGLGRSLEIHESLTNLVLQGRSVGDIAAGLAEWLGASVQIADVFCNIIARSVGAGEGATEGHPEKLTAAALGALAADPETLSDALALAQQSAGFVAVPISGPSEPLGIVVVGPIEHDRDELAYAAAGHAAVAVALSMLKEREVAEAERRLHGDLIEALLAGGAADLDRRAAALGLDVTAAYGVGVVTLRGDPGAGASELARLRRHVEARLADGGLVIEKCSRLVVLKRASSRDGTDPHAAMAEWWEALYRQISAPDRAVLAVAGPVCSSLQQLSTAFPEVDTVAGMLGRMGLDAGLVYSEQLGVYHLLLQVPDASVLSDFADKILEDLEVYDAERASDLIATVRSFFQHNRKLGLTAKSLHLHPHSVKYRLQRVADLTGGDVDDASFWLNLEVALKVRDLLSHGVGSTGVG